MKSGSRAIFRLTLLKCHVIMKFPVRVIITL